MNLSLYIARRYLISKKSHNIINVISGISVMGIMVGTMALIVVLSVFNGFESLVSSLYNSFNPDLEITIKKGKTFTLEQVHADKIREIPGVLFLTEVVEENALLKNGSRQYIARMKGVGDEFRQMTAIDSAIIDGEYILQYGQKACGVFGAGISYHLGVFPEDFAEPVSIYVPSRTAGFKPGLEQPFNQGNVIPAGVFSIQQDFDLSIVLVPIWFARELLEYTNELTALEIGLSGDVNMRDAKSSIKEILGEDFFVKDRYEQEELLYKIMNAEKWVIFLILAFILMIATFNVIGSLSMLIIDKQKDIAVLHSLGANNTLIKRIFLLEGLLISLIGAIFGLILGGLLSWIQQEFGIIRLGQGEGFFIIDAYPVEVRGVDFLYVFLTVFVIGYFAAWLPARMISRKYLERKLA
ncbi:MAG: FtsX-like permease family protein [Bacteroidales bacterium]|nr:FtsX-like permease family protein [Bacteroidales bacterium]